MKKLDKEVKLWYKFHITVFRKPRGEEGEE